MVGPMSRIPKIIRFSVVNVLVLSLFFINREALLASMSVSDASIIYRLFKEFFVGCSFAFIAAIPGVVMLFFGRAIDMQVGLGAAGIFNPSSKTQDSLTGVALHLGFLTVFFAAGWHLDVITIVFETTKSFPLGGTEDFDIMSLVNYFSRAFVLGVVLFFPVLASLFIVDIAAGVISKGMPQMNVYFVALPLKILVGIIVISLTLQQLSNRFFDLVHSPILFLLGS
jgi:flagellar biosynthesis protein FliR